MPLEKVDKEVDGVLEEDGDEDEEEANGSECPCRGVFESGAAGSGVHCHDGLNLSQLDVVVLV